MQQQRRVVVGVVSIIGASVVLFGVVFHDTAWAVLQSLPTTSFGSWAWSGTADVSSSAGVGFVHLNCSSNGTCNPANGNRPNVQIDVDTGAVDGWGWIGVASADTGTAQSMGWLNFDPLPLPDASTFADARCPAGSRYPALDPVLYPNPVCTSAQVNTSNQQEVSGWARLETLAVYGDTILGSLGTDNDWGWVLLRGRNSADQAEFGVLYRDGALEGWAYSGGGTVPSVGVDPLVGLGWISFSAAGPGSTTGPGSGYVSTERGNVYVAGGIKNPAGPLSPSQYNATFMILSSNNNSIVNFSSELLGEGNFTQEDYETLNLPSADNAFASTLGALKLDPLTTMVDGARNVYENEVVPLSSLASFTGDFFLDGAVYVIDNGLSGHQTYTLSNPVTFINGTSALPTGPYDGSGVIVVNGDLVIDSNVYYNATQLFDVKNLASVAWVVRGDLIVSPQVSTLSGAFFVIGDDTLDGSNDGAVVTQPATATQLVLYGLVMARSFDLQRNYEGVFGSDEPSELFYYDGRAVLNTPPGLRDFTTTLPLITADEN